mmetsp:Transcript_14538/g.32060  ORF Transcript_14538/g.32060 Transcript_14538/m.32060 type:complete len:119 (+) Transcript_14538:172-528(+)
METSLFASTGPQLTGTNAVEAAKQLFGVAADAAKSLGSERDQAFLLTLDGQACAFLKVSNAQEDAAVLNLEAAAAMHIVSVDPSLPVPIPKLPLGGTGGGASDGSVGSDGQGGGVRRA